MFFAFLALSFPALSESLNIPSASSAKLLVIGDIQRTFNFTAVTADADGSETVDVKAWAGMSQTPDMLDKAPLSLDLAGIINEFLPDQILQTGDLVDYNNGLTLNYPTPAGLKRVTPLLDEWAVLGRFPNLRIVFPTIGNHENYKTVIFKAEAPDAFGRARLIGKPAVEFHTSIERQALLQNRFPHLADEVQFHAANATYFREFTAWCLLSVDSNDLVSGSGKDPDREALFKFMDDNLARCRSNVSVNGKKPIIVLQHAPIFVAAKEQGISEPIQRRLVDLFDRYNVALVVSGHEHHYLRYAPAWLPHVGYGDFHPKAIYMTAGCFGCPYASKTRRTVERNGRFNLVDNQRDRSAGTPMTKLVYHPGDHYVTINVEDSRLIVTVFAFFPEEDPKWRVIDSIRLEGSEG